MEENIIRNEVKAGPGLNQGMISPGFAILAFYDISDAFNGYILLLCRWS